jgi:hypothetical protein
VSVCGRLSTEFAHSSDRSLQAFRSCTSCHITSNDKQRPRKVSTDRYTGLAAPTAPNPHTRALSVPQRAAPASGAATHVNSKTYGACTCHPPVPTHDSIGWSASQYHTASAIQPARNLCESVIAPITHASLTGHPHSSFAPCPLAPWPAVFIACLLFRATARCVSRDTYCYI